MKRDLLKPRNPKRRNVQGASPVKRVSRTAIGERRTLLLYIRAGGRCEFRGCNKYLLKHPVTHTVDNYGELAHIVAYRPGGPRGTRHYRPADVHEIENLMLLCDECHKEIDRHPAQYPVALLRSFKREHEDNVYHSTGIMRSQMTAIVRLEAPINGQAASIPLAQIDAAISPRLRLEKPSCHINLNALSPSGERESMKVAARTIAQRVKDFLTPGLPTERIEHVSIFGLAPIPLLVFLGYQIGNTIPADVYHHHHDRDNWTWKEKHPPHVNFEHRLVRPGKNPACVALLVSISGSVDPGTLPEDLGQQAYVYEISPRETKPSTNCLQTRESLENFERTYENSRRDLRRSHPHLEVIHLFPAVPPPIAILCGRELMPKVDPALVVYDYNKTRGGFTYALEVNNNDVG